MSDNEKVTKNDLYDKLWEGRDFELSHLWQRSIFLATFIVALFTIYFSVLDNFTSPDTPFENSKLEIIANENLETEGLAKTDESMLAIMHDEDESIVDKPSFQLIALDVICLFGFMFSVLWICMAKGSKYWYERHENGIDAAQRNSFFDDELGKECRNEFYEALWESGNYTYIPRHGVLPDADHDYRILHLNGARYSASKINIVIGYIFAFVWIVLLAINSWIYNDSDLSINVWIFFIIAIVFCVCTALFIAYSIHSDARINILDFILLILHDSTLEHRAPDNNQLDWLEAICNRPQSNDERNIVEHTKNLLHHYNTLLDNRLENLILRDFIHADHVNRRTLRFIYNNELLRGIFETALMHRWSFPRAFCHTWRNPNNPDESIMIRNTGIDIRNVAGINGEYEITSRQFIALTNIREVRLYADTDWQRIRAGYHYDLINDARRIHIVSKEINGRTVYMTLSFPDSISDKEFYYGPEPINGNRFTKLHVEYHEIPAPEVHNGMRKAILKEMVSANIHFDGSDGMMDGFISDVTLDNTRDFDLIFIR